MQTLKLQAYVESEEWMVMWKVLSITPFEEYSYVYIEWNDYEYQVDNKNIRLWTWLLDKNGKDIYEGDIIKVTDKYDQMTNKYIDKLSKVVYDHDWFYLKPISWEYKYESSLYALWRLKEWSENQLQREEIIWNIYENSWLINK